MIIRNVTFVNQQGNFCQSDSRHAKTIRDLTDYFGDKK